MPAENKTNTARRIQRLIEALDKLRDGKEMPLAARDIFAKAMGTKWSNPSEVTQAYTNLFNAIKDFDRGLDKLSIANKNIYSKVIGYLNRIFSALISEQPWEKVRSAFQLTDPNYDLLSIVADRFDDQFPEVDLTETQGKEVREKILATMELIKTGDLPADVKEILTDYLKIFLDGLNACALRGRVGLLECLERNYGFDRARNGKVREYFNQPANTEYAREESKVELKEQIKQQVNEVVTEMVGLYVKTQSIDGFVKIDAHEYKTRLLL